MKATFGFSLLLLAVSTTVLALDCPKACPLNYAPICATDGEKKLTFDNECELNVFNCEQHTNLKKTELSECSFVPAGETNKCQMFCPEIYAPVCAIDGQKKMIFDNQCILDAFNCLQNANMRQTEFSECSQDCPKVCPFIYAPVCATDGQRKITFDNECKLNVFNCEQHANLRKTELSECSFMPAQNCQSNCPKIYEPICATDGQKKMIFDNQCLLNSFNCEQHDSMKQTEFSECSQDCPTVCPFIYAPICATDGQRKITFDNECNLKAYNCYQHTNLRKTEFSECSFMPAAENCQLKCTKIYEPVCATDGLKKMLFNNDCLLNAFNCEQHTNLRKTELSECSQDCPKICPLNYAPICATDGQRKITFDNECQLDVFNCEQHASLRKTELSECSFMPAEQTQNCQMNCPKIYEPICATDGVHRMSFNNECLLNAFNCEQHANLRKTELSQCAFSPYAQKCQEFCPRNYAPVCATDGHIKMIFNNNCMLDSFNCEKHTSLRRIQWPC